MESKCVVCHDKPARFRCIQCHKPVCDDCSFKTEHGAFCGRDCASQYREWRKSQPKATRGARGALRKLIILIIILAIAAFVAHQMGLLEKIPGLAPQQEAPPAQQAD